MLTRHAELRTARACKGLSHPAAVTSVKVARLPRFKPCYGPTTFSYLAIDSARLADEADLLATDRNTVALLLLTSHWSDALTMSGGAYA